MTELAKNPRYANFARFHGRSPEEQLAHDKTKYPGGASMMDYAQWNTGMITAFSKVKPEAFTCSGLHDHDAYDEWLTLQVDEILRSEAHRDASYGR